MPEAGISILYVLHSDPAYAFNHLFMASYAFRLPLMTIPATTVPLNFFLINSSIISFISWPTLTTSSTTTPGFLTSMTSTSYSQPLSDTDAVKSGRNFGLWMPFARLATAAASTAFALNL